ncbi:hypothetical protein JOQ06_003797 [Pogonophryne albipinna]|uniref:Uncharacterized protein n=1 Tax=Pogonophryne albipinna TaxID=1090488 RepID=A0AAD6AHM0_9TELE|nr:hypothetical protein JOQ06_003797 [Pogonophryne albipinna]
MATASSLLSEEKFLCSVCLQVFTKPVTTPCGHNFCSACIHKYWDGSAICQCPLCKRTFSQRPELHVNTFVSELAAELKTMCKVHNKITELYCRTDQACVCVLCMKTHHKSHDVVPIEEEFEVVMAIKDETMANFKQMIQSRSEKIAEIESSVDVSQKEAEREKEASVQVFSDLISSLQRNQAELVEGIEESCSPSHATR